MATHNKKFQTLLPHLEGKVVIKNNSTEYKNAVNQYATSATLHDKSIMNPSCIIYAKHDNDVVETIKYAQENNIAIAIRTGGHQYTGMSSTSGRNIQLDLSRTYLDFDTSEFVDKDLITCGISYSLEEFTNKMFELRAFVPHGICGTVHLGGHIQTGGYGLLTRSFGLLGDHIVGLRVITADGIIRNISKDIEPELFYAFLGGSAGNFGVLTHATMRVNKDVKNNVEVYPYSRGFVGVYYYSVEHVHNLITFIQKLADNADDIPADFDVQFVCLSGYNVLSDYMNGLPNYKALPIQPATILVYSNWANLDGYSKEYDPTWFNKLKQTSPTYNKTLDIDIRRIPLNIFPKNSFFGKLYVNENVHTPLSVLSSKYVVVNDKREYNQPHIKRNLFTSKNIPTNYANVVCDRISMIQGKTFAKKGCKMCFDLVLLGGKQSKLLQNRNPHTSYSWRDTLLGTAINVFYNPNSKSFAEQWIQDNDEIFIKRNIFSNEDRRLIAFPYFLKDDAYSLDLLKKNYYDDDEKYEKLLSLKKKYDPSKVFSANDFCIGGRI